MWWSLDSFNRESSFWAYSHMKSIFPREKSEEKRKRKQSITEEFSVSVVRDVLELLCIVKVEKRNDVCAVTDNMHMNIYLPMTSIARRLIKRAFLFISIHFLFLFQFNDSFQSC